MIITDAFPCAAALPSLNLAAFPVAPVLPVMGIPILTIGFDDFPENRLLLYLWAGLDRFREGLGIQLKDRLLVIWVSAVPACRIVLTR